MGETCVVAAIISAAAIGIVEIIKALFSKNSNKELEYQHQERIIELMGAQAQTSNKTLEAIEGLRDDVGSLKEELKGLNTRVLALEEKHLKT